MENREYDTWVFYQEEIDEAQREGTHLEVGDDTTSVRAVSPEEAADKVIQDHWAEYDEEVPQTPPGEGKSERKYYIAVREHGTEQWHYFERTYKVVVSKTALAILAPDLFKHIRDEDATEKG